MYLYNTELYLQSEFSEFISAIGAMFIYISVIRDRFFYFLYIHRSGLGIRSRSNLTYIGIKRSFLN